MYLASTNWKSSCLYIPYRSEDDASFSTLPIPGMRKISFWWRIFILFGVWDQFLTPTVELQKCLNIRNQLALPHYINIQCRTISSLVQRSNSGTTLLQITCKIFGRRPHVLSSINQVAHKFGSSCFKISIFRARNKTHTQTQHGERT